MNKLNPLLWTQGKNLKISKRGSKWILTAPCLPRRPTVPCTSDGCSMISSNWINYLDPCRYEFLNDSGGGGSYGSPDEDANTAVNNEVTVSSPSSSTTTTVHSPGTTGKKVKSTTLNLCSNVHESCNVLQQATESFAFPDIKYWDKLTKLHWTWNFFRGTVLGEIK